MPVRIKWPFATQQVLKVLLPGGVAIFANAGAPSNGTTGAGFAGKGSICIDSTNGKAYINTGTLASSTWTVVGAQT